MVVVVRQKSGALEKPPAMKPSIEKKTQEEHRGSLVSGIIACSAHFLLCPRRGHHRSGVILRRNDIVFPQNDVCASDI